MSQRAAGPRAPPGWLLGLSVLDQTRPTSPRSPRLILHLTSHPRAQLWSGWPSPEEPCPKWPTWGPSRDGNSSTQSTWTALTVDLVELTRTLAHHPGRAVPITQTIQLTSGSHRGRRPVDRSQDLQQMRQNEGAS